MHVDTRKGLAMPLDEFLGQLGEKAGDVVEGAQGALENVDLGGIVEGAQGALENVDLGGILEGIFGGDKE